MVGMYNGTNVYYDGFLLNDYIVVRKIETALLPKVANTYQGLPHRSGAKSLYSVYGQIKVKIEYTIRNNVLATKDMLNRILFTREDKPLIIGDQPDRQLLCKIDGDTKLSSRVIASEGTLEFISPNHYWSASQGWTSFEFGLDGRAVAENAGTAPTEPIITIDFEGDCGYIGLVAPNGIISIGNPHEEDDIEVPPSEFAINHKFSDLSGWTRTTDGPTLIPDYNKLTSQGTARSDGTGMLLDTATLGTAEQWNGHAYIRNFAQGQAEIEADNFILEADVDLYDNSGKRNNLIAMLIVVMDEQNNPIMTTSIYDASTDKNELVVTFKVPDTTKPKHSKIIYSGKLNRLDGKIQMSKSGAQFEWLVTDNTASSTTVSSPRVLKVNDIVQLKNDVKHIYDWNGRKLWLDTRIIGQDLKITQTPAETAGSANAGRYLLNNVRYGYVEGFFNPDDIKQASTKTTTTTTKPTTLKHAITDSGLAQLRPYKVFVWQAKWGQAGSYSVFRINDLVVRRLYTTDKLLVENTFKAGDQLIIDNTQERITLNGVEFDGFVDVDSRFFDLDGGLSEIVLAPSEWAQVPKAKIELESRWF